MRRDVRGDGALAVARDAARALGAEGLTGASPMPAALPSTLSSLAFVTSEAGCQTPLTSRLPHADADPELAWLESTTLDLRRLVPGKPASARDSSFTDAGADDGDDVDVAFVEAVLPHRPKQSVPSTPAPRAAALPPLPALPIGSRLLAIEEMLSSLTSRAPTCCASDLRALWSDARAAARAAAGRECQKENRSQTIGVLSSGTAAKDPELSATLVKSVPMTRARHNALAPVVPFAVVGRLRLARAAPGADNETETEDDSATGLFLEDATGRVAVASVDIPDARLLGKRVLCAAWTLLIESDGARINRALLEVARFTPLDAPSVVVDPLPAIASAAVHAPPPPRRGAGFEVRGAVTAVSPVICLTVPRENENGAAGRDASNAPSARHAFFLVELSGDACVSCGRNEDETDSWRRRLVFTGDALARWRPFFGAAMGGEGASSRVCRGDVATCGCVVVTNLRASRLFKGEGERRELRVAAATAATTVVPADARAPSFAKRGSAGEDDDGAGGGCSCASCARGDTISRLDAHVLAEDPSGLGVRVSGRRDGRGVPFLLTHARVGSPPRDGVAFPALRPGSLVRVTHAHPVWRREASMLSVAEGGVRSDDASDDDDDDDDANEEDAPRDETDHFGCSALGACVRTRVRVLRRSPLAARVPRLFAVEAKGPDDDARSRSRSERHSRFVSPRAAQRHCETRSFVAAARARRLALALARFRGDRYVARDTERNANAKTLPRDASGGGEDIARGVRDGDAREASAALAGLVLGKRKRGGERGVAEADRDAETRFRAASRRFHEALARAASLGDAEDEPLVLPRAAAAETTTPETRAEADAAGSDVEPAEPAEPAESARASVYREFFAPIGLGGLEARVPRLPTVSAVLREASRAFAEAAAAGQREGDARDALGDGGERVPFGASVGAARCDRLVLPGDALFAGFGVRGKRGRSGLEARSARAPLAPAPVALVGWLAHRTHDGGARRTLELSDTPFPRRDDDRRGRSRPPRRGARGSRVHVEIEEASARWTSALPLEGLVVLTRWTVFCEGVRSCDADDPREGDPEPAACRVHVRVRREDLAAIGAGAPGGGFGERRIDAPPAATLGVSDVLVWGPDRSPLGGGASLLSDSGPGGVPLALARSERPPASTRAAVAWPPAPWFPPPFLARVTRDERVLDDRGGERKLRLRLADTRNDGDVVDAYVGGMDPRRVPLGVGAGAVVLVERAAAHVSASANVYLKLTSRTVLRVVEPAASTLARAPERAPRTDPRHGRPSLGRGGSRARRATDADGARARALAAPERPSGSRRKARFATLDAVARGAAAGFDAARVDRRKWTVRARVARVSFVCAKWACLSCGCDAGSFGAASAAATMRLIAERRAQRARDDVRFAADRASDGASFGPDAGRDVRGPPSDVAGCSSCRPPAERFRDDAELARAVDAACGFEVEVGACLTNGEAAADCWIAGGAGNAALPGSVRAALLALAKKHGRVVARFDAAAAAAGSATPYVTEGYCGRALGEVERGPLLAAVGHAASLGEVLATVEYKYGAFRDAEAVGAAALSAPGPVTRIMSLGGVPIPTAVAPTAKLRATALEPVEPAREAARMLAEEADTTSEK